MIKTISLIFFCLFVTFAMGQKKVKKSLINSNIEFVDIRIPQCFELKLSTNDTNEVIALANIEGEYSSEILLKVWEEGKTLKITTGFNPNFSTPNDKLSAHKVLSISLEIILPKYMKASVYGTYVNVMASGDYEDLNIVLADGECNIENIKGSINVKTHSGSIYVKNTADNIKATTTYGTIYGPYKNSEDAMMELNSVTGDIHINKTK